MLRVNPECREEFARMMGGPLWVMWCVSEESLIGTAGHTFGIDTL